MTQSCQFSDGGFDVSKQLPSEKAERQSHQMEEREGSSNEAAYRLAEEVKRLQEENENLSTQLSSYRQAFELIFSITNSYLKSSGISSSDQTVYAINQAPVPAPQTAGGVIQPEEQAIQEFNSVEAKTVEETNPQEGGYANAGNGLGNVGTFQQETNNSEIINHQQEVQVEQETYKGDERPYNVDQGRLTEGPSEIDIQQQSNIQIPAEPESEYLWLPMFSKEQEFLDFARNIYESGN